MTYDSDWRDCTLGEIATVSWGDTSVTKKSYVEEGYTAFSASGPDGYLPYADHHQPGVVLSAIGANCGRTWYATGRWSCIKNTIWYRPALAGVSTRFLYYATSTASIWPRRGSAQPFIALGDAKALPLRLPPLAEQRKIAAVLSAYDDLIANNTRRIEVLEEMAKAIYREWFVEFRYPGHEGVPLVESELGPIPVGWVWDSLSDRLESYLGGDWGTEEPTSANTTRVRVIRGTDIPGLLLGAESRAPLRYISESSYAKRGLRAGDLVLENSVNANSRTVGRSLLVTEGILGRLREKVICASFCKNFRLDSLPRAVHLQNHIKYLRSEGLMDRYRNIATNGIGNFQAKRFVSSTHLARPPSSSEYLRVLTPLVELSATSVYSDQIAVLRRSRDLLLPRLVSGEVDVSYLDIDVGGVA